MRLSLSGYLPLALFSTAGVTVGLPVAFAGQKNGSSPSAPPATQDAKDFSQTRGVDRNRDSRDQGQSQRADSTLPPAPVAPKNEKTESKNKRFVLGKGDLGEMSIDWDFFFPTENEKVIDKTNQKLPFGLGQVKFGNRVLNPGDVICSPKRNGNYLVRGNYACWTQTGQPTILLRGFKDLGVTGNNSASSILISSCSFILKKKDSVITDEWTITMGGCRDDNGSWAGYVSTVDLDVKLVEG